MSPSSGSPCWKVSLTCPLLVPALPLTAKGELGRKQVVLGWSTVGTLRIHQVGSSCPLQLRSRVPSSTSTYTQGWAWTSPDYATPKGAWPHCGPLSTSQMLSPLPGGQGRSNHPQQQSGGAAEFWSHARLAVRGDPVDHLKGFLSTGVQRERGDLSCEGYVGIYSPILSVIWTLCIPLWDA